MGWTPCVDDVRSYPTIRLVVSLILQKPLNCCPNVRIYPSVLALRKNRPAWLPRVVAGQSKWLVRALRASPTMRKWAASKDWFRAPTHWPRSVLPAFKWRLIPSPVELGSIQMRGHFLFKDGTPIFEHCVLLAYCYGFTLPALSKCLGISQPMLERHMFHAIGHLSHNVAPFIVWATATDYYESILPNEMFQSLGGKRKAMPTLQNSPFRMPKRTLDAWAASPRIMTHLIYHTEKKSRLGTSSRDTYLSEAPHGST